jgi:hypothetical protein
MKEKEPAPAGLRGNAHACDVGKNDFPYRA